MNYNPCQLATATWGHVSHGRRFWSARLASWQPASGGNQRSLYPLLILPRLPLLARPLLSPPSPSMAASSSASASPLLLPTGPSPRHRCPRTCRQLPFSLPSQLTRPCLMECAPLVACPRRAAACLAVEGVAPRPRRRVQEQGAGLRRAVLLQGRRRRKRGAMRGS